MSIFVIQEKKLIAPGTSLFQKNLALVACHREKRKNILVNIEENRKSQGFVYVSRHLKKSGNEKSSLATRVRQTSEHFQALSYEKTNESVKFCEVSKREPRWLIVTTFISKSTLVFLRFAFFMQLNKSSYSQNCSLEYINICFIDSENFFKAKRQPPTFQELISNMPRVGF